MINLVKRNSGFTLIEMLLAVTIFALLGVAGFSILSNTVKSNDISLAHGEKVAGLQRAMIVIERDLMQLAQRTVRVQGEQKPQPFYLSHGEFILDSESQVLAFRRVGWTNPLNILPRSEVQSVAYRIVDENLERLQFTFPDPVQGTEPKVRVLLEGVEQIEFEFYNTSEKKWLDKWTEQGLPDGISILLKTKEYGEIKRIFSVSAQVQS
ncbi:type II secretion system minor pseudopilin GspJ [Catenovulum sediminis]|uniref:Type II secretion system protein J n=1 Tax=Catenovulum sediminis TaxID=1740262 RepID=A0ABV1RHI0_9ALTE|nr:type II secretion system minor pseudopilin GspJ [Catenovulum sediminis]